MSSTKHKLRLIGASAALAIFALGVGCKGFFVNPTLTSIAISPTAPQVQQGKTLQLQAFGTFDDGTRSQIKTGVSWASATPTVASIDGNTGILTGVSTGTSTITASAQALSSTATATVFLVINSIAISPTTANITTNGGNAKFKVTAVSNGGTIDITSAATLTPESNGTAVSTISCAFDGVSQQVCTDNSAPTGTYQIVASYSGSALTATATLTVP
jgi:hypothetical protein